MIPLALVVINLIMGRLLAQMKRKKNQRKCFKVVLAMVD